MPCSLYLSYFTECNLTLPYCSDILGFIRHKAAVLSASIRKPTSICIDRFHSSASVGQRLLRTSSDSSSAGLSTSSSSSSPCKCPAIFKDTQPRIHTRKCIHTMNVCIHIHRCIHR